ncbi:MAG TPA: 2OG-Fe(II) oxygenase family protein [Terriglobales bacterium]|nr:2OG-Fe(II) oxygenase family protein [Terriglobales bacterium]
MIPRIDIAPLFGPAGATRDQADAAIATAAAEIGFMLVAGLPRDVPITSRELQELKRIFALPATELRGLWRQKFLAANANVYRGWFPLQDGHPTYKEGIDMGPDIAYGAGVVDAGDPLREATPLPADTLLPGWRQAAADYYRAMERVGQALMRSIARGLGLDEQYFDDAFRGGVSTFRLIHYPPRPDASVAVMQDAKFWTEHEGKRVYLIGAPHADSGLVTLLAQDGVAGLQALARDESWIDVPPQAETLVVNFGKLLERWTGGRIKATQHRVIGHGEERYSVPFFYEPRVDALIEPLPTAAAIAGNSFEPFLYGDHVWAATTKFVEFHGLEHLRPPRRSVAAQ